MSNPKIIEMMKYFLLFANINKISLCMIVLKMHFHYLVYHIGPDYFNVQKSVLYMEKSVFGQVIILNKSSITQKRCLVTVVPNIKYDQAMNKIFNVEL